MKKKNNAFKEYVLKNYDKIANRLNQEEKEKIITIIEECQSRHLSMDILKPGDYIAYNSNSVYTGLWRVLYDGTTEDNDYRIEIISECSVRNVTLGGQSCEVAKKSYANCIEILNSICNNYLNKKYASFARCVGTNPLNPQEYDRINKDFVGDTEEIREQELNQKLYVKDEELLKSLNMLYIFESYWLASRKYYYFENTINFTIRYICNIFQIQEALLYSEDCQGYAYADYESNGLRPVITLKPTNKIISGEGTKQSPYVLG